MRLFPARFCNVIAAVLIGLALAARAAQGDFASGGETGRVFRAGAAAGNITPRLGTAINGYFNNRVAMQIHDELHARCLVLDDGQVRIALVVCDSCMIPREVMDAAKRRIEERTGLAPSHVLISATHTHTAPACVSLFLSDADRDYQAFLTERIADAVSRAIRNLAPAKIGWGSGKDANDVFNRRWKMKPGTPLPNPFGGQDRVRMNPPVESPDLLEPAGPTDPEIAVVSVLTAAGRPLALLADYSLHYVGTGNDDEISADYYGAFAGRVSQLLGAEHLDPPFVGILANGTSADINNIDFRRKRGPKKPYEQVEAVAEAVASEACRVCLTMAYRDWVPLGVEETELTLGVRLPAEEEIVRAEKILAAADGKVLTTPAQVYARETVLMKDFPKEKRLIIQAIRIGDLGIVGIPCEVFAETGLAIKRQSPFKQTFTIELANGYNGYLPTPAQHQLGGYETWRARSSYLEVDAAPKILGTALELLAKRNH